MRRKEIEENLRDEIAFREELVAGRGAAIEKAEAEYRAAKADYLTKLAEIDDRIARVDKAIEKWRAKLD